MAVRIIPMTGRELVDWRPEDASFWSSRGEAIARRNLWISIPALLLAFAVWMVWSAVVVDLPRLGFAYSADQLFWLAALPGLSGATLRIFYSFMVPIFGGRRWTAISTASLLVPAFGIGERRQEPIVDREQIELGQFREQPRIRPIAATDGQVVQETRRAHVGGREAVPARTLDKRGRQPAFPDARRSRDQEIVLIANPRAGAEAEDRLAG